MPPSQRSTSSRSAHKDSSEIATDQNYALGEYSFRIERTSVPGSTNDQITAICTQGGKNARKSIQIPSSTQMLGWYVEANETEASVYIQIKDIGFDTGDVPVPVPTSSNMFDGPYIYGSDKQTLTATWTVNGGVGVGEIIGRTRKDHLMASGNPGATWSWVDSKGNIGSGNISSSFTYQGKTVYYYMHTGSGFKSVSSVTPSTTGGLAGHAAAVAWTMIYGVPDKNSSDKLVGRFAIDTKDAGGVGPDSDWDDPGDYEDGWEPGEPTHTLNVEVDGALSGRHNDPLNDTSYSYLPSDKATVKDYGCGGDGGNGGGGGAGASSVVVYKFPTSRADSKEITATAKRHGYGSGGGKGGKGGDGCILIYY